MNRNAQNNDLTPLTLIVWLVSATVAVCLNAQDATNLPSYYAHPVELDSDGVIRTLASWIERAVGLVLEHRRECL